MSVMPGLAATRPGARPIQPPQVRRAGVGSLSRGATKDTRAVGTLVPATCAGFDAKKGVGLGFAAQSGRRSVFASVSGELLELLLRDINGFVRTQRGASVTKG